MGSGTSQWIALDRWMSAGVPSVMANFLRRAIILPILAYQKLISPLMPPSCRYHPSCSHYTKEAFLRHGLAKGLLLGLARIIRCNALFSGGIDRVPLVKRWSLILVRIRRDYRRFWSP